MFVRMAIIGTVLVLISLMSGMWTGEKVFGAAVPPTKLTDQKIFEITADWTRGLSLRHGVMWIVHKTILSLSNIQLKTIRAAHAHVTVNSFCC